MKSTILLVTLIACVLIAGCKSGVDADVTANSGGMTGSDLRFMVGGNEVDGVIYLAPGESFTFSVLYKADVLELGSCVSDYGNIELTTTECTYTAPATIPVNLSSKTGTLGKSGADVSDSVIVVIADTLPELSATLPIVIEFDDVDDPCNNNGTCEDGETAVNCSVDCQDDDVPECVDAASCRERFNGGENGCNVSEGEPVSGDSFSFNDLQLIYEVSEEEIQDIVNAFMCTLQQYPDLATCMPYDVLVATEEECWGDGGGDSGGPMPFASAGAYPFSVTSGKTIAYVRGASTEDGNTALFWKLGDYDLDGYLGGDTALGLQLSCQDIGSCTVADIEARLGFDSLENYYVYVLARMTDGDHSLAQLVRVGGFNSGSPSASNGYARLDSVPADLMDPHVKEARVATLGNISPATQGSDYIYGAYINENSNIMYGVICNVAGGAAVNCETPVEITSESIVSNLMSVDIAADSDHIYIVAANSDGIFVIMSTIDDAPFDDATLTQINSDTVTNDTKVRILGSADPNPDLERMDIVAYKDAEAGFELILISSIDNGASWGAENLIANPISAPSNFEMVSNNKWNDGRLVVSIRSVMDGTGLYKQASYICQWSDLYGAISPDLIFNDPPAVGAGSTNGIGFVGIAFDQGSADFGFPFWHAFEIDGTTDDAMIWHYPWADRTLVAPIDTLIDQIDILDIQLPDGVDGSGD